MANYQWSDLGHLKAAGLRVLQVLPGEGAETTLVVENEPMANLPDPRRSKLGILLDRLHRQALRNPGRQSITLPNGLRIDIEVMASETKILLARQDTAPSLAEFATVLNHWPYDPPADISPEAFEHSQWCCLRAAWPTPAVFRRSIERAD